jgi:protein O-mannosyl-transferase
MIVAVAPKHSFSRSPFSRNATVLGLLLIALCTAAYAGVVAAGFVWDDQALVVRNALTSDLRNLPVFFRTDLWAGAAVPEGEGASGYFRPLFLVTLALDRAIAGLDPSFAHLHSLAWHLLAVLGVFQLLLRLLASNREKGRAVLPALVGATIFALHPLQSEAVVWISARNDLMAAASLVWALVVALPADAGWRRLSVLALLGCAAVLSKESALLLPMLLLVLDLARFGRPRGPGRYAVLVGAIAACVGLRSFAGVIGASLPPEAGWQLLGHRALDVLATAGHLLVWPWPLSGGRDLESLSLSWSSKLAGLGVLCLLALGLPLLAAARDRAETTGLHLRLRLGLAGLMWAVVAFLPSILALADKGLFGERYLYLPMAGLALAVAAACPNNGRVLALLGPVPVAWIVVLYFRLPDWHDDLSLWSATLRDTPCTYVHAGLGHALRHADRNLEASAQFRLALIGDPPQLDVCENVIGAALAANQPSLAASSGLEVEARGCTSPTFLGHLAVALATTGRWDEALERASKASGDSTRRADVVRSAAALARGDCDGYRAFVADWKGSKPPEPQVSYLLDQGGFPEAAAHAAVGLCP